MVRKVILLTVITCVCGIMGALIGAVAGRLWSEECMVALGGIGFVAGLLGGAIFFKKNLAHLNPEALYEAATRMTVKNGVLYEGKWVMTSNGWRHSRKWFYTVVCGFNRPKKGKKR